MVRRADPQEVPVPTYRFQTVDVFSETRFGGNPLAMAVGNAVLDIVLQPAFLERVASAGRAFRAELEALVRRHDAFTADDLLGEIFSRFCIGK